jgi:Ca2+-binding RTX toxin-like protein
VDDVDFWVGGLAERQAVFGGLLGATFNFVFEQQLEHLRTATATCSASTANWCSSSRQLARRAARRNTDIGGTMDVIFRTADFFNFNDTSFGGTSTTAPRPADPANPTGPVILTLPNGTKVFFDPLHKGNNIVFNGGPGVDRFQADVGDDTLYGNGGADRLEGFEGNDTLQGGDGDDILFAGNGDDVIKGGDGNDAMSAGPGFGGDILLGGNGDDFLLCGEERSSTGVGTDQRRRDARRGDRRRRRRLAVRRRRHDGGMFGDGGNVFDLLAGLDKIGGDDVMGGGPGQDNHFKVATTSS